MNTVAQHLGQLPILNKYATKARTKASLHDLLTVLYVLSASRSGTRTAAAAGASGAHRLVVARPGGECDSWAVARADLCDQLCALRAALHGAYSENAAF